MKAKYAPCAAGTGLSAGWPLGTVHLSKFANVQSTYLIFVRRRRSFDLECGAYVDGQAPAYS